MKNSNRLVSFKDVLFIVMVSLVIFPILTLLVIDLKIEMKKDMRSLAGEVSYRSSVSQENLNLWIDEQMYGLLTLSRLIGDPDRVPAARIQHLVDVIRAVSPAFLQTTVMNRQGISIAVSPRQDATGSSTVGLDFSDRHYVSIIRKTLQPYISDIMLGRIKPVGPTLPMVVPLVGDNDYKGFCGGLLDLSRISRILTALARGDRMQITLLDRNRRVVATTRADLKVMESFQTPPGSIVPIKDIPVYHWVPEAHAGSSIMQRWRKSYLFKEQRLSPGLNWVIIVQGSVLPILQSLSRQSILTLMASNLLIIFTVVLSHVVSRNMTRSLKEFQEVTDTLPTHLFDVSLIRWPESKIGEVHQLIDNFRGVAEALGDSFHNQKRLNERLNEAQRIGRMGSWEIDLLTGTLTCSDEIYRIYEIDHRDVLSYVSLLERVHPEDAAMVRQAHENAIQNKGGFQISHRLLMPDGRVKYVQKRSEIFVSETGVLRRYIATIHDITEIRQAEETIRASLHEKDVLLREIHHRVKNNLQVVSSLFSLQAEKSNDQRVRQALQESRQRIRAMAMIHETLYSGKSLSAIELPVYLQNIVNHLREVFSGQAGIRIVVDAADIHLNVDQAVACGLIINELLTNSLKYAFPEVSEGLVKVTVHLSDSGDLELVVSDNGVGLPPEMDVSRISSLGLQLVKGLVEHQLAGRWEVSVNEGTTFTIRWRLRKHKETLHGQR